MPTGVLETIPPSGIWREIEIPDRPPDELLVWDEPWPSGLDDLGLLLALVQSDVKDGFAEWLPGGMEEARKRFGPHCAAGKFGVVKKDGSAPRLVGDSSISNVNGLCRIREKIELPGISSIGAFVSLDRF